MTERTNEGGSLVSEIVITHYTLSDVSCESWKKTGETLRKLHDQMAPRFRLMGMEVTLLEKELSGTDEETVRRGNLVTFTLSELGGQEIPLEDLIGAETSFEPCSCGETATTCRTIRYEGHGYQEIPSGLLADAMLRASFSTLGGGCGSGCESCGGGCGGCGA
jgi:hypothetical protein